MQPATPAKCPTCRQPCSLAVCPTCERDDAWCAAYLGLVLLGYTDEQARNAVTLAGIGRPFDTDA